MYASDQLNIDIAIYMCVLHESQMPKFSNCQIDKTSVYTIKISRAIAYQYHYKYVWVVSGD